MELRKAIQRVVKVLPTKKDDPMRLIRLLPAVAETPPRVYATNGVISAAVNVDEDLPNALVHADLLLKASKDYKELGVKEVGYGKLELTTETVFYKLQGLPFNEYSMNLNIPPDMEEIPEWDKVLQAMHAASKPKDDLNTAVVNFTYDHVETLDRARLARSYLDTKLFGFVPIETFKAWRKGRVDAAFTDTHAYFKVAGEEYRITALAKPDYPNTGLVMPREHPGPDVICDLEPLENAVKQSTAVSNLGIIRIEFQQDAVHVKAWEEGDVGKSFVATIPVLHTRKFVQPGGVLINGKHLCQCLKLTKDSSVLLGWGDVYDPLRVQSDKFVTCIWQMGVVT